MYSRYIRYIIVPEFEVFLMISGMMLGEKRGIFADVEGKKAYTRQEM